MGDKLVIVLIAFYLVIVAAYVYDHNWRKALYWFGAILISIAVLKLK